jgi:hypothetical protein
MVRIAAPAQRGRVEIKFFSEFFEVLSGLEQDIDLKAIQGFKF